MKHCFIYLISLFTANLALADSVVNVYAWGGEIPKQVILQFEKDTGIHVNFSTYDNNETLYSKLRSSKQSIYDVILPSAYFVERMQKQGMLTKIDHNKLTNIKNIDPRFTKNDYDKGNRYSVPLIWGATGIFYNQHWIKEKPHHWQSLWNKRWRRQLMLLDDSREVFAMALMSLNYKPNDENPKHIHEAYQKLLALIPNIKFFASDGIQATIIDEDALAGSVWNGDVVKAQAESKDIQFVYPDDGFVIWIDCLAIPINAPHPNEAYQFINYLLKPEIAIQIALKEGHAITNQTAFAQLPDNIRHNINAYPPPSIMKHGFVQRDVGDDTIALYNHYWQSFKLAF